MAFGEYIPIDYGQQISNTDVTKLSGTVQTALQQRFDVNSAKMDEMLAKVASVPLTREKDKQYLHEKLNGLINTVNNSLKVSGGQALLNNSVTAEVGRYITSAIDPYIKTQMANSQAEINFNQGVEAIRAKGDGKYADKNYQYALSKAGYEDWKSGKSDTLGTLRYTDYRDVMGNAMKKAKDFKDLKGDQTIEYTDPNTHVKTTRKVSGLSPEEIVQNIPGFLDAQDEQQLVIDGWDVYKGNIQAAQNDYNSTINATKEKYQKEIAYQDAILAEEGKHTAEQIDNATKLKSDYQNKIKQLEEQGRTTVTKDNIDMIGYGIKKNQLINNMSNLFSGRVSITTAPDEMYFKIADLELKYAKEARDIAEHGAKMKKEYGVDATGKPLAATEGAYVVSPEAGQKTPEAEFYTAAKQTYSEAFNNIINTSTTAYNDVTTTEAERTKYRDSLHKNGFDLDAKGTIVPLEGYKGVRYSKADVAQRAFFDAGMNLTHAETSVILGRDEAKRKALGSALVDAEKTIVQPANIEKVTNVFNKALNEWDAAKISPFTSVEGQEAYKYQVGEKMKNYVAKNGGMENLKKAIKSHPEKIQEMQALLKEGYKYAPSLMAQDTTLNDLTNAMGTKLKSAGILPFVKMKMTANVRDNIIQRIVQEDGSLSATFDKKAPMTTRQVTDGIEITQEKGAKTDKDGNVVPLPPAKKTVLKGTAAYDYIMQRMGGADEAMDVKDVPTNYKLGTITKPTFIKDSDDALGYFSTSYNTVAANDDVKSLHLEQYATKNYALMRLKKEFGNKYSDAQLQNLVERVDKGNKEGIYDIAIIPNQTKWATQLIKNGRSVFANNVGTSSKLSNGYRNLVQQHSNLVLMQTIVDYLKRHPSEIDNI